MNALERSDMRKDYQILCLDKDDKPKQVATLEATSPTRARLAGQRLATSLNLRFHLAKPTR